MTIEQLNKLPHTERAREIVSSVRLTGNQLNNWFYSSVECDTDCAGFCVNCLGVARGK